MDLTTWQFNAEPNQSILISTINVSYLTDSSSYCDFPHGIGLVHVQLYAGHYVLRDAALGRLGTQGATP